MSADPNGVPVVDREHPVEEIGLLLFGRIAGASVASGRSLGLQSELPHDASYALLARVDVLPGKLFHYPVGSVSALVLLEDTLDEDLEHLPLYLGVALGPLDEGVVSTPGDIQDRAGLLDAVFVPILLYEPESDRFPCFKKARNFFSISFSISSSSIRFLSLRIS